MMMMEPIDLLYLFRDVVDWTDQGARAEVEVNGEVATLVIEFPGDCVYEVQADMLRAEEES